RCAPNRASTVIFLADTRIGILRFVERVGSRWPTAIAPSACMTTTAESAVSQSRSIHVWAAGISQSVSRRTQSTGSAMTDTPEYQHHVCIQELKLRFIMKGDYSDDTRVAAHPW